MEVQKFILSETRSNKDVYDFTLEHGHIPKHAIEVLRRLKKENRILYTSKQPLHKL